MPLPTPGEAICITKHGRAQKAFILHPDDFVIFQRLLELFGEDQPYELRLTETALAAHRLGETAEDDLDFDYGALGRAIGD